MLNTLCANRDDLDLGRCPKLGWGRRGGRGRAGGVSELLKNAREEA